MTEFFAALLAGSGVEGSAVLGGYRLLRCARRLWLRLGIINCGVEGEMAGPQSFFC